MYMFHEVCGSAELDLKLCAILKLLDYTTTHGIYKCSIRRAVSGSFAGKTAQKSGKNANEQRRAAKPRVARAFLVVWRAHYSRPPVSTRAAASDFPRHLRAKERLFAGWESCSSFLIPYWVIYFCFDHIELPANKSSPVWKTIARKEKYCTEMDFSRILRYCKETSNRQRH